MERESRSKAYLISILRRFPATRAAPPDVVQKPNASTAKARSMNSRVLHRVGGAPPVATGGEGIYLHRADGMRIIDGSGGAAVACLGHGNRRIAEAIGRQAATMAYAHTGT